MKCTIGKKRYNSERCEIIAKNSHYNHSNNYCGSTQLLRATDGQMLTMTESNGQDLYLHDSMGAWDADEFPIENWDMTDEQEALAIKYGLIEIV